MATAKALEQLSHQLAIEVCGIDLFERLATAFLPMTNQI
jgi:hypothetical protein